MQKTLYYKVKYGFKDDEVISITDKDLKKALYAQINGGIVILDGGSVSGNNIISITPDLHRVLGLNPEYKLTGEDYRELGDEVIRLHRTALEGAKLSLTEGNRNIKKLN